MQAKYLTENEIERVKALLETHSTLMGKKFSVTEKMEQVVKSLKSEKQKIAICEEEGEIVTVMSQNFSGFQYEWTVGWYFTKRGLSYPLKNGMKTMTDFVFTEAEKRRFYNYLFIVPCSVLQTRANLLSKHCKLLDRYDRVVEEIIHANQFSTHERYRILAGNQTYNFDLAIVRGYLRNEYRKWEYDFIL